MRKFWRIFITSGVFQYAAGFYFVGVLLCSFKTLGTYSIILYAFLIIFNIVLGTRNFINFYKREEVLKDQLEERLVFMGESLRAEAILRNQVFNEEITRCGQCVMGKKDIPEKKIVRLFGSYRTFRGII